jgi:two-component system, response regulator, stage 0 sporulation protein F
MSPNVPPSFTALVVDDDHSIQILLTTLLERQGIAVECVADGNHALERLQIKDYGAIILDLMLPGMNGFDVVTHLKRTRPELLRRVIVVTAVSQRMLEHLDDNAVRRLIRKPFDIFVLINEVLACRDHLSPRQPTAIPGAA